MGKDRCIAKPETYEQRKARREAEINGLKQALSILDDETAFVQRGKKAHGGAHYSFLETSTKRNLLRRTATCPSTSVQCGMEKDAAGDTVFVPHELPTPGACVNIASAVPEDGKLKICGPGTFSLSRMSCDKHDYKAVTITQPTDQFSASDCKVYSL